MSETYTELYAMTESESLSDLIGTAFPVEPLPTQFFSTEGKESLDCDIPQELRNRISGRPWTEVTLMAWTMTGSSPVVARRYLEPATFMYYVPSIVVGVLQEMDFIELALEGIIPDNKNHVPRGNWWFEFSGNASPRQRAALATFLLHIRFKFWDTIGPVNQYFLEHAENIWSG
jgi:hypothetical protein